MDREAEERIKTREAEQRIKTRDAEERTRKAEDGLKKVQMDREAEERIKTREAEDSLKKLQMEMEAEEKNKIGDADLGRARLDSELKLAQFNLESQDRQRQSDLASKGLDVEAATKLSISRSGEEDSSLSREGSSHFAKMVPIAKLGQLNI